MAKEPRRLRVYQQWQGNERFFCWGHCVTGPSWKSGLGSLLLLIAPTVVFLVFVAPYMSERVTPAIMVVSCILPVFCASMLLMTSCRDPGILPRQEPDEEWLQGRKARAKDVIVNGHRVTVRYNDTCHFYQPPRAHHCSVNDNCIERFDHHCPWVGTTIGKRNYRTFLMFIYSTSIYIAWTFGVSLGSLFVKHRELGAADTSVGSSANNNVWLDTLGQSGAAIALMVFSFIFFWFVCGLSGFHTWLVATNQTTYENFRYNHNQVPNPYDEGCLRNCASVWCVRVPPSKVDFRAYIDDVQKVPVEMGYAEWNTTAMASPLRSGMDAAQQGYSTAPVTPEPLAPDFASAASQEKFGQARFAGLGSREAVVPIQGYDSLTEACSQAPITRADGRSGQNMLTAIGNTAQQSAAASYNPLYGGNMVGDGAGAGMQGPALQQMQQQAVGGGVAAPAVQQQGGHAPWQVQQSQQALPRTFSPLGGAGNGPVSPEHVAIEMAAGVPVATNGNLSRPSSGSGRQQLPQWPGDRSLDDIRSPRTGSPARISSAAASTDAHYVDARHSAGTEYADARQSDGSWASQEELREISGVSAKA